MRRGLRDTPPLSVLDSIAKQLQRTQTGSLLARLLVPTAEQRLTCARSRSCSAWEETPCTRRPTATRSPASSASENGSCSLASWCYAGLAKTRRQEGSPTDGHHNASRTTRDR